MKHVPGYSDVVVTEDGRVFSKSRNGWVFPFKHKSKYGHYLRVHIKRDDGKRRPTSIHTLVCLAYHGAPPETIKRPEVNHLDGNKINNHFTNLEWVTRGGNMKHAWDTGLLIGNVKPVILKDYSTGEVRKFDRAIGVEQAGILNENYTFKALRTGKLVNGKAIIYDDGKSHFKEFSQADVYKSVYDFTAFAIQVRCYLNDTVKTYANAREFLLENPEANIRNVQVHVRLTHGLVWPVNGYSFRYVNSTVEFIDFDEVQIGWSFNPKHRWGVSKEIIVTRISTQEKTRYPDRVSFAKALGINPDFIKNRLERHAGLFDDWQVEYYQPS